MDREISTIMRSKSSNDGVLIKAGKKHKESNSEAHFAPNLVKKQRSYDKTLNPILRPITPYSYQNRRKPPPRPRPGQKKFLASVLTILSKSTTGTQYPDIKDKINNKTNKRINRHERDIKTDKTKKQIKYKSRILNRCTDTNDQLIILQSRKDIAQTPSNYSETCDLQKGKSKRSIRNTLDNNIYNAVAEGVANVLEDKSKKEKRITINDNPETLASKTADEEKKIYNLFVDLLESTFNDNNLNNDALSDTNCALEIKESIAKKLMINNEFESNDIALNIAKGPTMKQQKVFDKPIDIKLSDHKPLKRVKRRISVKSFVQAKKVDTPQTQSFQRKQKIVKNRGKRNLLNIFKEELQLKPTFEEPQNLFQALKVMAKNKKIKNVTISSEQLETGLTRIKFDEFDNPKCKLKRRKIISLKPKKYTKTLDRDNIVQKYSEYNSKLRKRDKALVIPSCHSLKVFEYNYEEPQEEGYLHQKKNQSKKYDKQNLSPLAKSSPFDMKSNLDYYTLLKFPDRSTYHFTY